MKSTRKSADETTRVVFRKYPDGQVIALFPDILWGRRRGEVTSYMHLGQHGAADYSHVIAATKPVTENEYRDLQDELKLAGYENIKIIQRSKIQNYDGR
ncbi:hypothetical protein GAP53_05225 [Bacteroides uniformis]|nr:hypothetical protein [Bacteroides uniformis]KAB4220615.1 hypothetical protein GAP45_09910 [Bacteroides uniformis]KAB4224638.1 hypothetical protein GAP53_05225 [Bacteroides uniformis]KAB4227786.1 hypothetical protein GAP44_13095 [Bacteroides uniformis]KAB4240606.1 hypothetical protein GAP54_09525 [Bacteroides uniformis]KAB4242172.1 hypothetical protein GAP41_11025 [Bacteroides uniformis]